MPHPTTLVAALTAALAAIPSAQAGMYLKSSPVLQVDAKNFDSLITKSNHTSVVEFYAPWCGHCQNLKPAYEKAARNLEGLAKVAAIDCDDDANRPLCTAHDVKGFPTLKTFRPGTKPGKPIVEDYRGPRTASGITDDVVSKINNHVTKVTDKDLDDFLAKEGPKAVLFTEKGKTSALLRSVAIDFLDVIKVGQIRNKENGAVERFAIESFPTLVLIPEGTDSEPVIYDGELKKDSVVEFLTQAGEPNPDYAPAKSKEPRTPKTPKDDEPEPEPEEAPEASSSASSTADNAASTMIPISPVSSTEMLQEKCLQRDSHTCVLAIVPSDASEKGTQAVESLSKLNAKYIHGKRHLFPFFSVSDSIDTESGLRKALELSGEVELVAVNARRKWWRHYEGDFSLESVETWIDAIRLGEGDKKKLPKDIIVEKVAQETPTEETSSEQTRATDPEPEVETEAPEPAEEAESAHDEL